MLRDAEPSDADAICSIYNEYILNTTITFEETPLKAEEMASRICLVTQSYPWLVYEEDSRIVGYAYAGKWKERSAYRYSVETAIYMDSRHVGKGIGTQLMKELLKRLKAASLHSVISGIALPNPASIALCERFGFKKIAHFSEVGYKMNRWVDVGYWELLL
jgi:L-amino acid N-acyltransferase YncA